MPTGIFNAGRATAGRAPAPPLRTPYGWSENAYMSKLMVDNAGAAEVATFDTGAGPIPVFLFLPDYPCAVMARSSHRNVTIDDSNANTYSGVYIDNVEHFYQLGDMDGALMATIVATPVPAAVQPGQICAVTTLTNGLAVKGYGCAIDVLDQSATYTGDPEMSLLVIGESGVIAAPQSVGPMHGALTFDQLNSIILQESDYTAAMLAADNIWTDTNGDVWKIVGLHVIPGQ